jgi:hypothetical protein
MILKMKNKDEINTKLLQLEINLEDSHRQNEKLKHQIELNEKRISSLEDENDELKTLAVNETKAI